MGEGAARYKRWMTERPLILVTNDDGVSAPGIAAAREALLPIGDVIVAAPDRERSASSHSISLDRPLRVDDLGDGIYSIDGTPVDCVYLALLHLVPRRRSWRRWRPRSCGAARARCPSGPC